MELGETKQSRGQGRMEWKEFKDKVRGNRKGSRAESRGGHGKGGEQELGWSKSVGARVGGSRVRGEDCGVSDVDSSPFSNKKREYLPEVLQLTLPLSLKRSISSLDLPPECSSTLGCCSVLTFITMLGLSLTGSERHGPQPPMWTPPNEDIYKYGHISAHHLPVPFELLLSPQISAHGECCSQSITIPPASAPAFTDAALLSNSAEAQQPEPQA